MRKYSKISNKDREKLFEEFCEAISVLKTPQEVMNFIADLLTKQELVMLSRRIEVAKLLIKGRSYREIEDSLNVAHTTISRVNQWLLESGEGFRLVSERTKKPEYKSPSSLELASQDWRKMRRRYPLMFWPQLLMEEVVKNMNKKQKEKVRQAVQKLDHKSSTFKQINKILES